jgi:hypothetical protein
MEWPTANIVYSTPLGVLSGEHGEIAFFIVSALNGRTRVENGFGGFAVERESFSFQVVQPAELPAGVDFQELRFPAADDEVEPTVFQTHLFHIGVDFSL